MYAWRRFARDDSGQDLAEYAMLIALIALLAAAGVLIFAGRLDALWRTARNALEGALG